MRLTKSPWLKVIIIAFVMGAALLLLRLVDVDFSKMGEEEFRNWVRSFGIWGPITYIIVYVLRPLILLPAGIFSATAGVIWGPALGFLYVQIAANLSSTVEFLMARYVAREALEKRLKGRMADLDERIGRHGFLTVLFIRLIPNVAWDIQNLSLGLTKVRFRDYFLATLIGIMPNSFAFVFFGSSLIRVFFDPRTAWILALAILIFAGVCYLQRYLRKRNAGRAVSGVNT